MAHFPVLVITPERPNPERLRAIMAPYRCFEVSGLNDEYVQTFDRLEEVRTTYESSPITRYRSPQDGGLYDPSIYWELPLEIRKEYEEVHLPAPEAISFLEFVQEFYDHLPILEEGEDPDTEGDHKWGWVRSRGGEVTELVKRTNPNAKWDWYRIGGRWQDFYLLKNGRRFCLAQKGAIDFEKMREGARNKVGREWDIIRPIIEPYIEDFKPKEVFLKAYTRDEWEAYFDQPLFKALEKRGEEDEEVACFQLNIEPFLLDRDTCVEREGYYETCVLTYIKDGIWHERDIEKDIDWCYDFNTMLENVPDDHWLTIIDCHI